MRAFTSTEFCLLYKISYGRLKQLYDQGMVFCLGNPRNRARWLDPGADFMHRILDRQTFCDNARWLNTKDVAAYFGVTDRAVSQWVLRGLLQGTQTQRRGAYYFSVEDVRRFREKHIEKLRGKGAHALTERLGPAPARKLNFKEETLRRFARADAMADALKSD